MAHSKSFKQFNPLESCPPRTGVAAQPVSIDWKLCALCQETKEESLQCPANSKRTDRGAGYKSLAEHLLLFSELGITPFAISLEQLNDGSGIENTLLNNKASWQKSCRDKVNSTKLKRAQKRRDQEEDATSHIPVKTRRTSLAAENKLVETEDKCFFCNDVAGTGGLHNASTFEIDRSVRESAMKLKDTDLLAKLASGDMVAIEAKYHAKCLASLYNRVRKLQTGSPDENSNDTSTHGIAFAALVSYLEEFREDREGVPVFKLVDLAKLYSAKLQELGIAASSKINTTRLKERLLGVFPDLSAHIQGRYVLLVFDHAIGDAIKKACEQDSDSEALCLAKAAKIVRRDLFKTKCVFDGTFPPDCQSKCVPESLKALVNMILEGPSIKKMDLKDMPSKMACLTISQLLAFNSTKHPSKENAPAYSRHSRESEYPLSIYVALKIHGETRKRSLIDAFYNMGLCISHDRVLTLSTNIANSVTNKFEQVGVVCPPKLCSNIFTTAGVDNIDHNPSSTTAHDSFHGTAISLVQHRTTSNKGSDRGIPVLIESAQSQKKIAQLPEVYTNVPPAFLQVKEPFAPAVFGPCKPPMSTPEGDEMEYDWLNRMRELFGKETLEKDDFLSWAGFHASRQPRPTHSPAIISLLPMFLENAHSVAMILHSMNVIKSAVQHLNPRQAPVITLDQPLYAIAKQIQWNWPASHGEDKFVIMLGGLHIEMAAFKVLGNWLDGSGWASVIADAGVASTGVADSFIKASHLTRTRRAHQITAASLSILQNNAYCKYQEPLENSAEMLGFKDWKDKMSSEHPQFHYWCLVLELELCVLQFVRSLREANFKHYFESLAQLAPWMFSLDHINYARWLSIHIRDMCTLLCKHPAVFQQFSQGAFVVHKSPRVFSSIAMDHAHEQANASVKGDGGAVCLTESPGALLRWSVAGPELARMMQEFEEAIPSVTKEDTRHHEQTPGVQVLFKKDVTSLVSAIEEVGNPFEEDSKDLYALDSKVIMGGPCHPNSKERGSHWSETVQYIR